MTISDLMRAAPVIPVLVLDGEHDLQALAETLVKVGLPVLKALAEVGTATITSGMS
jgi:2-dehydro-3-deoxyphosphogluconate aldolase/(4S)-4-hydroxy-2-oxoglutarate aldolase